MCTIYKMPILDSNKQMTVGTGPHNQHQLVLCGSGPLQFCAFCTHNSTISFQETLPTVKASLTQGAKKKYEVIDSHNFGKAEGIL